MECGFVFSVKHKIAVIIYTFNVSMLLSSYTYSFTGHAPKSFSNTQRPFSYGTVKADVRKKCLMSRADPILLRPFHLIRSPERL